MSETSVHLHQATRRHMPENNNTQSQRYEKIKSPNIVNFFRLFRGTLPRLTDKWIQQVHTCGRLYTHLTRAHADNQSSECGTRQCTRRN
jgi:hypothetical protein